MFNPLTFPPSAIRGKKIEHGVILKVATAGAKVFN
jgi:hypothetical protein